MVSGTGDGLFDEVYHFCQAVAGRISTSVSFMEVILGCCPNSLTSEPSRLSYTVLWGIIESQSNKTVLVKVECYKITKSTKLGPQPPDTVAAILIFLVQSSIPVPVN